MYRLTYWIVFIFLKLVHRLKVYGKENIPVDNSLIVASNHFSYYDPVVTIVALNPRQVCYMAKAELFKNPFLSFFLKRYNAFSVRRGHFNRETLKTAISMLKNNKVVGVFPEGTRAQSGHKRKIFQGAAYLSYKSGAPVLPVVLIGTNKITPEGMFFPRCARIKVNIGKPLKYNGYEKDDLAAFSAKIMEEIDKLQMSVVGHQSSAKKS